MNGAPSPSGRTSRREPSGGPFGHLWMVGLFMGGLSFDAIGEMIFGALGVTPEDPAWGLALLLGVFLALSTLRLLRTFLPGSILPSQSLCWISRGASGALLGFAYGSRWAGDDSRGAIAGALVGLGMGLGMGLGVALGLARTGEKRWVLLERVAGETVASLCAYSLGFWLGAWSLAALMAGSWLAGLSLGLPALWLFWASWLGFRSLMRP